jgi:hypothetical protein
MGLQRGRRLAATLSFAVVWLHAVVKVGVMSAQWGYGRPPFTLEGLATMARVLPEQVFLSGAAWWIPLLFAVGLGLYCRLGLLQAPRDQARRLALLLAMLAASVGQYLLLWLPVWRYSSPTVSLAVLTAVIGFGLLLARAQGATQLRRRCAMVAALALAFALTVYRDLTVQFSMQYMAGQTESAMLETVSDLMDVDPGRRVYVIALSEYEYRTTVFFNWHSARFLGRPRFMWSARDVARVPAGHYLVSRAADVPGFDTLAVVAAPPAPRIVSIATIVSRWARLGAGGPPPPVDAGAPGVAPESWYVLRRRGPAGAPS